MRNGFSGLDATQIAPQQFCRVLLDKDFLLELISVAHFHEFVGVAGIAVFAGELTAAVGIDGPCEREPAVADAAVQQGTRGQGEVFNVVAFAKRLAFGRKPGDADEWRLLGSGEQGQDWD